MTGEDPIAGDRRGPVKGEGLHEGRGGHEGRCGAIKGVGRWGHEGKGAQRPMRAGGMRRQKRVGESAVARQGPSEIERKRSF